MERKNTLLIIFIILLLSSCKKIKQENPPQPISPNVKKWVVTTVAGDTTAGFGDGPALQARFKHPIDVAVSSNGTLYVADAFNGRIRKISGGQVSTFVGNGSGDTSNGRGTAAGFLLPSRLALDKNGNIYTLDGVDSRIRRVTPSADVTTYSGTFASGFKDGKRDMAQFGQSFGIAVGSNGTIYISDSENRRVRRISSAGHVTTIAGTGVSDYLDGGSDTARFFFPQGIVIDKQGNLFVADGTRVRKITPQGFVSTFVGVAGPGFRDGKADEAQFDQIEDLVIGEQGNIYVTDQNRIRQITPMGVVSTVAGSGETGFEDGIGTSARFNAPQGLAIDQQGRIFVADFSNNCIRQISFQ